MRCVARYDAPLGTTPAYAGLFIARDDPALRERRAVMAWVYLVAAGVLEVVWAYTMKLSEGFTQWGYSVVTVITMMASFGLLSVAMKSLARGTAYTIWTGIGAVGAFVLGIMVLGEAASPLRILAAVLIVVGLVLMKLSS